jgi:hypothetical protein
MDFAADFSSADRGRMDIAAPNGAHMQRKTILSSRFFQAQGGCLSVKMWTTLRVNFKAM